MSSSHRNQRVDEAIAAFMQAEEAGTPPDREAFLDAHAELRSELESFLSARAVLQRHAPRDEDATLPPSSAPVAPMDIVRYFGDYEIIEELARGGMGVVFRARQVSLNRVVALKMILSGSLAGAEDVARFRSEAEAAANLDHPNVCPIYEVGEHHGQQYYSMKLIAGGSLAGRVATLVQQPREAAELLAKVADAVHHAHVRGILHRDLKPANVLLDEAGVPYVTDFGLARKVEGDSGLTKTGAIVGTPSYMAPEQASARKDLTTGVDVYALGAILYECLTGQPPFTGPSPLDVVLQVIDRDPVPPSQINARVPRDLETICLKCLEKEPGRRYASGQDLADDVERYLGGEPILARPVGPLGRTAKWVKRNPAVASLMGLVGVAVTVGITVSLYFAADARQQASDAKRALVRVGEEKKRAEEQTIRAEEREKAEGEANRQAQADRRIALERVRFAERLTYAARIPLAYRHIQDNQITTGMELLQDTRWDFRNWEHAYLSRLGEGSRWTLRGHYAQVLGVAWSKDGKLLASGSNPNEVRVWDATTGELKWNFRGHRSSVLNVAFSPDNKWLVSASADRLAKVWNLETGDEIQTLSGHTSYLRGVAINRDGSMVATTSEDLSVRVWKSATWQLHASFAVPNKYVWAVAFHPDGRRLAAPSGSQTLLWDLETKKELRRFKSGGQHLTFSPDGMYLVTGDGKRWEVETGKEVPWPEGASPVRAVAYSRDGKQIIAADGTMLKLHDAQTGREVLRLQGHRARVRGAAFSPDGKQLISGGEDHVVKVWDLDGPVGHRKWEAHQKWIRVVAFSNNGQLLASGGYDGMVHLWNPTTGDHLRSIQVRHWVHRVAFSNDDKFLAIGGGSSGKGTFGLYDAHTGDRVVIMADVADEGRSFAFTSDRKHLLLGRLSKGKPAGVWVWSLDSRKLVKAVTGEQEPADALVRRPDEKQIVTGPRWGAWKLWDVGTRQEVPGERAKPTGQVIEYSPDGKHLLAKDKVFRYLDATTWSEVRKFEGHSGNPVHAAFSPDGRRLVGASAKSIYLWDVETGQLLLTLEGHNNPIAWVTFSPDGKTIASCDGHDRGGEIRLWEVKSAALRTIPGAGNYASGVAFSNTGQHLAVASGNIDSRNGSPLPGGVQVWDLSKGRETVPLKEGDYSTLCVAFRPDGGLLAAGGADGSVRIWDVATGKVARTIPGRRGPVQGIAFHPQGKLLASAGGISQGGEVKIRDATTGQEVLSLKGLRDTVYQVAFTPDGRSLAGAGREGRVWIWDVETGQVRQKFEVPGWHFRSVSICPKGKRIAAGGGQWDEAANRYRDCSIRLWDANSGKELNRLEGHEDIVTGLSFDTVGKRLASSSRDRTVRVWNLTTLKVEHLHRSGSPFTAVAFSQGGWLAAARWGEYARRGEVILLREEAK